MATPFDIDTYFAERTAGDPLTQKLDALSAIHAEKIRQLETKSSIPSEQDIANQQVQDATLVGKLGYEDAEGVIPGAINTVASGVSGAARFLGYVGQIPNSIGSSLSGAGLTEEQISAYNRLKGNTATAEDKFLLNARPNPNLQTPLESIESSQRYRDQSQDINETFDLTGLVNQNKRQEFMESLSDGFGPAYDKVTGGIDAIDEGRYLEGIPKVAKGIGSLLVNAGSAILNNKAAVVEHIVENIPQIAVGAFGAPGMVAMTAGNVGYAIDEYQKGLETYSEKNNGQLPSLERQNEMATQAFGLVLAEQAADVVTLGATKLAGKAAKDIVKSPTSLKKATLATGKAGAQGALVEAPTEGIQTYLEGQINDEPATPKEIYQASVVGGAVGSGIATPGRALSETARLIAEPSTFKEEVIDKDVKEKIDAAIDTGDVSSMADNPAEAIRALFGNAQKESTTEETRKAHLKTANKIIDDLEGNLSGANYAAKPTESIQREIDEFITELNNVDPTDTNEADVLKGSIEALQEEITRRSKLSEVEQVREREKAQIALAPIKKVFDDAKAAQKELELLVMPDTAIDRAAAEAAGETSATTTGPIKYEVLQPDEGDSRAVKALEMFDGVTEVVNTEKTRVVLRETLDGLGISNFKKEESAQQLLDRIRTSVSNNTNIKEVIDPKVTKASAETVINVSMENPERFSPETQAKVAENKDNGLTDDERDYLSEESKSRIAQTRFMTLKGVQKDILEGNQNNNKNKGIKQYKELFSKAVASDNITKASVQLKGLTKFANNHKQKAELASKVFDGLKDYKDVVTIQPSTNGSWVIQKGGKQVPGSLTISVGSGDLVNAIKEEAKLLTQAAEVMDSAFKLKFINVLDEAKGSPGEDAEKEVTVKEPVKAAKVETARKVTPTEKAKSKEEAKQLPLFPEDVDPGLDALKNKSLADTEYNSIEVLADFFKQTAITGPDGSQKALVAVKDFYSSLRAKKTKVTDYLVGKEPTDAQQAVVKRFFSLSKEWGEVVKGSLPKIKEAKYRRQDMTQYLLKATDGNVDMEENIKTAISFAVFQYVSEHADDDFVLEDKNINKILGRKEETKVSKEARETLNTAGFYQHFLIDALGNTVLKSLGLEAIPSAGQELTAKLRTALGTHALNLAEEVGLLQATPVTSTKINELRKEGLSRKGLKALALANAKSDIAGKPGNQYFYAIKRKEYSNEISEAVAVIRDSSRDTQNILPKLFGVDVRNRWPSLSPVKFIQEFAVNTRQNIPKFLRKVLNKKQKEPYNIKKDNLSVLDALTGDYLARVLGAAPVSDETTHVVNRSKRLAKNKGLQKEFKLLKEYADSLPDGLDTQFYFNFSVWKQQRVGIENSNVNPQASLVARYLVASNAWKADIALNNKELMDSFFLRVGEGLGIKTERADKEIHLGVVKRIVKETIYVDAIAALHKKLIQEETLTEKDQEAISKAVEEGGESVHTLDVLVNMVYHNEAVKKSESSGKEDVIFSVQMLGLVDGVASGTMLNHILFGAADSVSELLAIGEQGGIYDETYDSYPEWRGKSGHKDIYETTGKLALRRIGQNEDITASIKSSIKALSAGSELFKGDARALIKDAMNPLIFGAGMDRVRENLADTFINSVYVGFEDLATKGASREAINEYVGHINNLLGVAISQGVPKMPLNKPIKYYINTPLTTDRKKQTGQGTLLIGKFETAGQETALRIIFNNIVGTAVTETLASEFETFLDRRAEFNKSAQTSYGLYEAVYTGERETYIQELVESGEIQKNAAGQPAADLSREQEATLQLRLEAIVPLIASAMAKGDEKNTGLLMANYERSVADSQDTQYQNITEFGKPNAKGFKSTAARGYKRHLKEIGISMGSWIIHSFDSQLSHLTQAERNVLNIHDAVGDGIAGLATSAELINKNTWKSLLTYSPAAEMELSLNGVVQGIAAMAEKGELSPQSIRNLNVFLNKSAKATDGQPDETSSDEILLKLITDTKYNAYIADTMKLGAMSEWFNVNQYAFQGGAYEVTFGDRAAAVKAQSELVVDVDPQTVTAIEALNKALNKKSNVKALTGAVATPIIPDLDQLTKTAFGPLGTPAVQSDPDLVALFKDNKTTAKEAIAVLIKKYELDTELPNRDFNIKLLKKIRKAVPAGLSIEQITSKTKEEDVIGLPSNTDVFGWAVFKPGAKEQAIYVLNSEFQNSGLTPELLLHELVHAAVVTRVRGKDKAVAPFVSELNALLKQAKRYVENNKATFTVEQNARFRAATSNLDELIAWGMTNLDFQKEVLDKIVVNPKSKPKAIKTALKTFIKNITGLLFGAWSSSDPEYVRSTAFSGMEALIHNVSNVIELANSKEINKNSVIDETITVAMSAEAKSDAAIDSYTTLEVFNSFPNNGKVAPEFETHLRGLLEGIVDKLHGPFGSFKEGLQKNAASTPLDVWLKALDTGKAPFASEVLNSGFTDNGQQSFVIEQVDATVRDALETKDKGMVSEGIRRELARLFTETKAQLTPEDFKGKFGTNTIEEATALYNFVFDAKTSTDRKSDYLARFAALGLAHEGFNDLLKIATKRRVDSKGKTFIERLEALFNSILDFYARMVTGVNKNDTAKARLSNLVERLVDIEAKRRHTLKREAQGQNTTIDAIETKSREAVDKLMKAVSKALKAPIVRKSKSSVVKAAGAAVRTIAEGRLQGVLQVMIEFKDSQTTGQLNIGQGVINAIKTPLEAFKILVRGRKHLEGLTVAQVASVGTLLKDAFKNQDLDEDTRAAVTAVFLRTGVHNLVTAGFSLTDIENLIANPIALKAAIGKLEGNLSQFGALKTEFIANASALGYHKVGGRVAVQELKQNAHQITRRFGVNRDIDKLNAKQLERADAIVKPLITLYALLHMEKGAKTKEQTVIAKDLMKLENSRTIEEGNGIELTIILQKALEEQALNELFAGNEALMFHAYVPEIYNYRTKIQTANEIDGRELINQGYTKSIQAVVLDPGDIDQSVKHVYKLTDGGAPPHLTAAMGYGSLKAKGTAAYDNYMQPNSALGNANIQAQAAVTSHRQRNTKALKINFDPATVKENYMAPVYNEAGKIVSHRYLMLTGTKDTLLERNSDFLKVLGELAGSIQGKQNTVKQNKVAITAMLEQYKEEYAVRGKSYMLVGEDSTDPELKAIWYKLPQKTKDDIKEAWGRNGVMVRRDAIDILFGYPKISAADPFRRANEERLRKPGTTLRDLKSVNEAQKLIIYIVEGILKVNHIRRGHTAEEANNYAKRAANLVAKSENVWQGVITEVKDIIVVKSGVVLLGNITSNFSMLYLQGVPVTDMFRLTWVAYNGASEFKADNNELNSLRISLATGYTKGDAKRIKNRIVELEDSIARNPVAPLINAGLMPTIVEDLDMSEDKYSFKSVLTKKVEKQLNRLPDGAVKTLRMAYMTRDGKAYQKLAHITQMSDFTARYVMYHHQTTRTKDRISHEEALQRASNAFVNYDIPLHRWLQYTDDMGFTMFTKYFLYIQSELLRVTKENPARVLSLLMMQNYLDFLPPHILESSAVAHTGNNPIGGGILRYPEAVQKIPSWVGAMAILK